MKVAAPTLRLVPLLLLALAGCATRVPEPPGPYYKKVSQLVHFPDFYPGLGIIYVQPTTLPYGPFQGYDRQGRLVDTIYMVPVSDIDKHTSITKIEGSPLPVDHVDIFYNSGHPGVDVPHYHIILWHISREEEATLK